MIVHRVLTKVVEHVGDFHDAIADVSGVLPIENSRLMSGRIVGLDSPRESSIHILADGAMCQHRRVERCVDITLYVVACLVNKVRLLGRVFRRVDGDGLKHFVVPRGRARRVGLDLGRNRLAKLTAHRIDLASFTEADFPRLAGRTSLLVLQESVVNVVFVEAGVPGGARQIDRVSLTIGPISRDGRLRAWREQIE